MKYKQRHFGSQRTIADIDACCNFPNFKDSSKSNDDIGFDFEIFSDPFREVETVSKISNHTHEMQCNGSPDKYGFFQIANCLLKSTETSWYFKLFYSNSFQNIENSSIREHVKIGLKTAHFRQITQAKVKGKVQ